MYSVYYFFIISAWIVSAVVGHVEIIGGENATLGQFRFMVSIQSYNEHLCGGAIINEEWIVTTAACVYNLQKEETSIYAGTLQLHTAGKRYATKKFIIHPQYNAYTSENDIGLINTEKITIDNSTTKVIELNQEDVGDDVTVTMCGWGVTNTNGAVSEYLQYIELITVTNDACNASHIFSNISIFENQLCTSTEQAKKGACYGDAGNPLIYQDKLVGSLSYGRPCASGLPDVSTRISSFYDWIKQNIDKYYFL